MRLRSLALILGFAAIASAYAGGSYDTYPLGPGTYTNAWTDIAQSFDALGNLTSYEFNMDGGSGTFDFVVTAWDNVNDTQIGAPLLDVPMNWQSTDQNYTWAGDLSLTAGDYYAAVVELPSGSQSVSFVYTGNTADAGGGYGSWSYSYGGWGSYWPTAGYETIFDANFGAATVPGPAAAIPALIGFGAILRRRIRR